MNASTNTRADHILNVRITFKTARVPLIESVAFKEKMQTLKELKALNKVEECLILQTCNRVEIYLVSEELEKTLVLAKDFFINKSGAKIEEVSRAIEISKDTDACKHLLETASGIASLIIGEDQIVNQVWNAYLEAEKADTTGPILNFLFNRAVTVGRRVRRETNISKGAVSIGSAAVELAAKITGNLQDKGILVIGAGEVGTLVAKALSHRCQKPIFIANRTYDRAVKLADSLNGKAVKFDKFDEVTADADVVICSTSAPHYLLTKEIMVNAIKKRRNKSQMIIIDISNPRNVEKNVSEIEEIELYNIDDLQMLADKNKAIRKNSIEKAKKIVEEELRIVENDLKALSVRLIISSLLSKAEEVRQKEVTTALEMIGELQDRQKRILDDLTSIILKQTFVPIVENLRSAAKNGDRHVIEEAIKLFEKSR